MNESVSNVAATSICIALDAIQVKSTPVPLQLFSTLLDDEGAKIVHSAISKWRCWFNSIIGQLCHALLLYGAS